MAGLNFETLRPRDEILSEYRAVVDYVYRPDVYFARVRRAVDHLDCSGVNGAMSPGAMVRGARQLARLVWSVAWTRRDMAGDLIRLAAYVLRRNPRAIRSGICMGAMFAHFGPFSRSVVAETDRQIAKARSARATRAAAAVEQLTPALAHK